MSGLLSRPRGGGVSLAGAAGAALHFTHEIRREQHVPAAALRFRRHRLPLGDHTVTESERPIGDEHQVVTEANSAPCRADVTAQSKAISTSWRSAFRCGMGMVGLTASSPFETSNPRQP